TRQEEELNSASKLLFGYVGSSNKVIDDPSYGYFQEMRSRIPELHAVEMEGSGAGSVIRLEQSTRAVGFLMIRGISDEPGTATAPSGSSEQRGQWKKYAVSAAAAFTEALLNEFPVEAGTSSVAA